MKTDGESEANAIDERSESWERVEHIPGPIRANNVNDLMDIINSMADLDEQARRRTKTVKCIYCGGIKEYTGSKYRCNDCENVQPQQPVANDMAWI